MDFLAALRIAASMTLADSSLVKGFLSAANTDWPITTANIKKELLHATEANDWPMLGQGAKGGDKTAALRGNPAGG